MLKPSLVPLTHVQAGFESIRTKNVIRRSFIILRNVLRKKRFLKHVSASNQKNDVVFQVQKLNLILAED